MSFTGLWVDDLRPLPSDLSPTEWCCAPTFHEAVIKLELIQFLIVSLDHDLGCFYGDKELTGYDILLWLVQRKFDGLYIPPDIRVHSANPVGHQRMEGVIKRYLTS